MVVKMKKIVPGLGLTLIPLIFLSLTGLIGLGVASARVEKTGYAGGPTATLQPRAWLPLVKKSAPPSWWVPPVRTTWQWQLTDLPVDTSYDVDMYDIDLFENDGSVVVALHAQGRKAIAYFSAGTWEDWRPDADQFPDSVKGNPLSGWPGEWWLDIRRLDVLGPIMEARLDLAVQKGFDGVEPDNVDGYANNAGFPLTAQDQLNYNVFLANAAHARGLSVALKNDVAQAAALEPYFDWTLNEECYQYNECTGLKEAFIDAGKAVMHVEYEVDARVFCPAVNAMNFNSMKKRWDLDAWMDPCW